MIWILGSSLIALVSFVVRLITDKWTNKHGSWDRRRLYNFMFSIWEISEYVSAISAVIFAVVMAAFLFSRIGVDVHAQNTRLRHDALVYEYEMLNSDCEDISKIEVINNITDWNRSVTWERHWAESPWTNWFQPKKVTEAYEYIELN